MNARVVEPLCPVCGVRGTATTVTCRSCGAYLQERVPVLHLFSTIGQVLTAPASGFHRIVRSERKNYTVLLAAASGPFFLLGVMILSRVGDTPATLGLLLSLLIFVGPLYGLLSTFLLSSLLWLGTSLCKRHWERFRDGGAVTAYAQIPLVLYGLMAIPLMTGVFGDVLFSTNPSPWVYHPTAAWMFAGTATMMLGWTVLNVVQATHPFGIRLPYRLLVALLSFALMTGCHFLASRLLTRLFLPILFSTP